MADWDHQMTQKIFHIPKMPKDATPCKGSLFEYGLLRSVLLKNVNRRHKEQKFQEAARE
jgi:hypothetical protein